MLLHKYETLALALSALSVFSSVQVFAQEAQLEEIVITARQRSEKLIDVPATIQAFAASEIKSAGIERPQDFIALTSGVSQVQTAEAGDMQVSIRGINTGRDAETNFALVIDGVLQTNPNALNQELSNVSQIEILKGPQGAVYGRNAVAGAMIISTRKPSDAKEFEFSAGVAQYNSFKASAYLSGQVAESWNASVSAYTRNTDGEYKNVFLKCDDCVDFFEETGISARLVNESDTSSWDIKAKYSKIDAGAINFNASFALKEAGLTPGYSPLFWENANTHKFVYLNNVKPQNEQENINLSVKADFPVSVGTVTVVGAFNDQTNYFLTDGTSAAFGLYTNTASCTASFAARRLDSPLPAPFYYGANVAGSLFPPYSQLTCDGYQYQQRDQTDMSVEVRVTSPGDQQFRWLAGAYAADIERRVVVSQGSDNGQGFDAVPLVRTGGKNPTDLLYDDDLSSTVMAAFGQIAYDVKEGLEVALALRYDNESRDVENNVPRIPPQTPGFAGSGKFINPAYEGVGAPTVIKDRSRSFSELQPKLSVNWKTSDNLSLFASYGVGFRSGGFNSTGTKATIEQNFGGLCTGPTQWDKIGISTFLTVPACNADGSDRGISKVSDDYEKEVSKAFEAGFKANLLDGALAINFAAYKTDIENMQFFNFFAGPFGLLRAVTNAEEASVQGFEIDTRWRVNQTITVFAGYGSSDTEIEKYLGRPYTKGNKIPYAPEYTANTGIDLKIPMGSTDWIANARLEASFIGETFFSPVQGNLVPNLFTYFGFGQGEFSKQKRDPYHTLNARIGMSNGVWGVTAWGRNITDEKYLQEVIPAPEFGGSFIHNSPGSSFGVDVNYSFR